MADVDLVADLNAEDDDGLGWSTLADAHRPDRIVRGAMLLAGNQSAQAVVRIVALDPDRQVHFTILPDRSPRTVTCLATASHSSTCHLPADHRSVVSGTSDAHRTVDRRSLQTRPQPRRRSIRRVRRCR